MGGCSYGITNVVQSYLDFSHVTNIRTIYEDAALFPTVTFCPINPAIRNYSVKEISISCIFNQVDCSLYGDLEKYFDNFLNSTCYKFNKNASFNQLRSGITNGLLVKLFIGLFEEPRSYNPIFNDTHGIHIYINNQTSLSTPNDGMNAQSGVVTNLAINKIVDQKLTVPYNDCIKNAASYHSFNDTFYTYIVNSGYSYRQSKCLDYAFLREQNCVVSYDNSFGNCFNKSMLVVAKRTQFYQSNAYKEYLPLCPLECDTISYTVSSSQASYPSNMEYLKLRNDPRLLMLFNKTNESISIDDLKKSIAYVRIYYNEITYTLINQQPKMNIWDLVSNLGGVMSLFMGISFLSFIDILQIILELLLALFEKDKVSTSD